MPATIHPIPPGLWCVPSTLVAITGAPWDAVIHPALNRHLPRSVKTGDGILDLVVGATATAAIAVLQELGYVARRYRADATRSLVTTWAARSRDRYPGRAILLFTARHALVAQDGRVYDNHAPHGPVGAAHPYAKTPVVDAYLIERK